MTVILSKWGLTIYSFWKLKPGVIRLITVGGKKKKNPPPKKKNSCAFRKLRHVALLLSRIIGHPAITKDFSHSNKSTTENYHFLEEKF